MSYYLDLQIASHAPQPQQKDFEQWVNIVLINRLESAELTIRIVDEPESKDLNFRFRQQNKPTNVLAFPVEIPSEVVLEYPLLGDLVICAPIVIKEAAEQEKSVTAHWAHMVIHGLLHLLGYDHIEQEEAEIMEGLEIELLKQLGFSNPYGVHRHE